MPKSWYERGNELAQAQNNGAFTWFLSVMNPVNVYITLCLVLVVHFLIYHSI